VRRVSAFTCENSRADSGITIDAVRSQGVKMKKNGLAFCGLAAGLLLAAIPCHAIDRALLIGINKYAKVTPLRGTDADVATMKALLMSEFRLKPENVRVLQDGAATKAGIIAAIENHLIAQSAAGDVAILYYSGHGSQMRDASGDETDGWDETLVAHDSRTAGVFDVSDDELNSLLSRLAEKTSNITVILDSCHSGTAARNMATVRRIPRDERPPPPERPGTRQTAADGPSDVLALGANFTLISSARASELANEDLIDGRIQGALTYNLAKSIRTRPASTYRDIFPEIAARVSAQFPSQNPQLEGTGLDSRIFGLPARTGARYLAVTQDGVGRAKLNVGAMHGLVKGTVLQIFSSETAGSSPAEIARLVLTDVTTDTARGRLMDAPSLPAGARALVSTIPIGGRKGTFWVDTQLDPALRTELRKLTRDHPALMNADEEVADFRLVKAAEGVEILSRDGTVLSGFTVANVTEGASEGVEQIEAWARWKSLLDLTNPHAPYSVKLMLRPADSPVGTPAPARVTNGTRVTLRLENTANSPLFFSLLNLGSSGRIALLAPAQGAQDQLAPGAVFERTYRMSVPDGRGALIDSFKVIVGDAPIDGSVFQQAAVKGQSRGGFNAAVRYISDRAQATSRDAEDVSAKEWATAQVGIAVTRSAPIIDDLTFAVHYKTPTSAEAVEGALSGQRSLCSDPVGGTDCARAAPLLSGDDTVFEVRSPVLAGQRGSGRAAYASVGQAFDEAYQLRDQLEVEHVEPLLTVVTQGVDDSGAPGTRGGDSPPHPIATGDVLWSLKYANALAAQKLIRDITRRAPGSESAGVLVAHPDTGFTRHPENWEGADPSPVFAERGRDYVDGDMDPTDPLSTDGALAHPGHGTASSSVIISPPDCQLNGKTQCVTGTGPGARIVPLRVHTSVVVFNTKQLARAITEAADGKLGERVDVISIAMGGPPSLALRKAVKRAEERGVLLIAAAGNYVQTVVWPARFDSAVAVSAINAGCVPWKHASHGRAVDISAPGEGVWRATFDKQGNFDIGMGAGTTFATGTTAGIATLWLAKFANDPALAALRNSGQLTRVFREALTNTAWRPESPATDRPPGVDCAGAPRWEKKEYGAGVVDALALLNRPLPATATRALPSADAEVLPQWRSLYGKDDAAPDARADYLAIFGQTSLDKVAQFETEILFHYTMNEDVGAAIDRHIAGAASAETAVAVRSSLLSQDLSTRLRVALQ
jgi:hypothetical protein